MSLSDDVRIGSTDSMSILPPRYMVIYDQWVPADEAWRIVDTWIAPGGGWPEVVERTDDRAKALRIAAAFSADHLPTEPF